MITQDKENNYYEDIYYNNLSEEEKLLLQGYLNIIEENKKGSLTDAHTHLSHGLFDILDENNLHIIVNGSNKEECEKINSIYKKQSKIKSSFGIHPWDSNKYNIDDMKEYLDDCDIIGEIGMDNVWCNVDIEIQKEIFIKQLNIALMREVPVILHTKGMEKEIFEIIKDYDLKFLVHWYSCDKYVEDYISKDCYFSIGPDVYNNENVQNVVKKVSLDRLLIETDGIDAVKWALNKEVSLDDICDILKNTLKYISEVKNIPYEIVQKKINANFREFCKGNDIRRNY